MLFSKRIFLIVIAVLLLASCKSNKKKPNIQIPDFDLSFAEEQPSSEQIESGVKYG